MGNPGTSPGFSPPPGLVHVTVTRLQPFKR